tara:strand:- start:2293 stop:2718 length:426 start_codon:yes stop_codon:yes gene_type:complete
MIMIHILNLDTQIYLFNILENILEKYIIKIENIVNNVKNKLELLSINKNEIKYDEAYYCFDKYLFENIYDNIILVNDPYIFGNEEIYESKILKNPTYFDILVETSKSIIETDDYCDNYMKGLKKIKSESNINYYEIILHSC